MLLAEDVQYFEFPFMTEIAPGFIVDLKEVAVSAERFEQATIQLDG